MCVCACERVYECMSLRERLFLFEGGISFPSFFVALGSLMADRVSVSAGLVSCCVPWGCCSFFSHTHLSSFAKLVPSHISLLIK